MNIGIVDYVDINPDAGVNRTLLLVHGWPGLWSTWSHQIRHFKDKYRLIAPDIRGFGDSTHPGDVQASGSYDDFVADLVCVLEKTNAQNVVCVGHDWGAQICYEAARMRPDLFQGVAGITLPVGCLFVILNYFNTDAN
jgi:soluble epoxide hydrolase/lipid-phosphate phosphatase